MGYDLWNHSKFLQHKVRNMTRRGWLLKTYNDKKMLRGRVKTGEKIENDELDIIHPVGYIAHVKADDKAEVITMDVGADTSRRVILNVMGDREQHPKPDEGEAFMYAPGDKKMYTRIKKKKEQGGGQGGGGQRADGGSGGGGDQAQTVDYGREAGTHTEGKDQRVTSMTSASYANQADKGAGISTKDGSMTIAAGQNTQFQASKHVRKGEHHINGTSYTSGIAHAADQRAGGGTSVSGSPRITPLQAEGGGQGGDDREPQRPQEDGTQAWSANGKQGTTSLLQTAAKVGTMGGMMSSILGMMQQQQQQQQGNQTPEQQEDMERRLRELEEQLKALQAIPDLPPEEEDGEAGS